MICESYSECQKISVETETGKRSIKFALCNIFEYVLLFTYSGEYQCADTLLSSYSGNISQSTGVLGVFRKVKTLGMYCLLFLYNCQLIDRNGCKWLGSLAEW